MNKESKILIAIALGTIGLLFGGSFLFNKSNNVDTSTQTKVVDDSLIVGENPHIKGVKEASINVVEFGDFQCPACSASESIVKKVLSEYSDKINLVFRHFPLEQHKNAFYASLASEAASEQGKFWEMHDILYEKQNEWGERNNAQEIIEGYAKNLGLDIEKFKKSIADKKFDDIVNKGITDGVAAGVNATPTFFVNGKKETILSFEEWKKIIERELASKK